MSTENGSQVMSVQWDKCQVNLLAEFEKLLSSEQFVDVTLAVESETIKCHKVVLSASSSYFEKILMDNPCHHPVIIMNGTKYWEMLALVNFMYRGEVSVEEENLEVLLKTAETLQIRGLVTVDSDSTECDASIGMKIDCDGETKSGRLAKLGMKTEQNESGTRASAKFKKACYHNSFPSFSTSRISGGVVSDTRFGKQSENMVVKEEVHMEFMNTDDEQINPSVEYGMVQVDEVSLEGTLSQIVSDSGSSSIIAHRKGLGGYLDDNDDPTHPYTEPKRPVSRFNHWPVRLKNRKRCAYCIKTSLKRKDVATSCVDCKVGLCLGLCFQKYHEALGVCGTIFFF